MSILELSHVTRHFGGVTAVDEVTFAVEPRTITSLVGPNGAGKTTVFNLISKLVQPSSGSIVFDGADITAFQSYKVARRGLGRTFQDPRMFAGMSVLEHVLSSFSLPDENPVFAILSGPRVRAARRTALLGAGALLDQFGLRHRFADLAQDLSFGEQRFLSIARTLACDPKLILLDEPSVGLDANDLEKLKRMIVYLARECGKTIIIIEHNLDVIFEISDEIHLLVSGKLVLSGRPDELRRHPTMIEAYLGGAYATLST
jgi:branched-chain amino acid transport system ATP-binding protein